MKPIIPIEKIEALLQLESVVLLLGLSTIAWFIYKILLRKANPDRHRNLQGLFRNLLGHLAITSVLIAIFMTSADVEGFPVRVRAFVGLIAIVWSALVFVKISKIFLFEYLFIGHMEEGVPLLLINIFTLGLSSTLFVWLTVTLFNVNVTPFLTTFGVASVVLGLAMQDTLGNLFAGISLQFDKPYGIGDWIEVSNGSQKWVGQVQEISWRATVMVAFTEELVTIPNRVMAQSQISNFTLSNRPIIRSQTYRIPYGTDIESVREILVQAAKDTWGVRSNPEPAVLLSEAGESWMSFKVVIWVDDYGAQYSIFDRLNDRVIRELALHKIGLAAPRLVVEGLATKSS